MVGGSSGCPLGWGPAVELGEYQGVKTGTVVNVVDREGSSRERLTAITSQSSLELSTRKVALLEVFAEFVAGCTLVEPVTFKANDDVSENGHQINTNGMFMQKCFSTWRQSAKYSSDCLTPLVNSNRRI
jgi:hypothetical protein